MKLAKAEGMINGFPIKTDITVRTETTGDFHTISFSDDKKLMILIAVNEDVKKILREIVR